jgi:hypothetical protein
MKPGVAVSAAVPETDAIDADAAEPPAASDSDPLISASRRGLIGASYCDADWYGLPSCASIVRNVTFSNSSSRISVAGEARGLPACGLTRRTWVENGVEIGRGSTKTISVPSPLIALVRP